MIPRPQFKSLSEEIADMIPKPIYELLPFIYVIFGTLAFLNVEWMTGRVSGLLLFSAGVIIWRMRRLYRAAYLSRRGMR